jgi:predicted Ser/Thr protein kinase
MSPRLPHPQPDELAAFVSGQAPEEAATAISQHLADCEACRTMVDSLPPDTLLSLLRKGAEAGTAETDAGAGEKPDTPEAVTIAPAPAVSAGDVPAGLADNPRYRVLELLGSGGMGAVYKAEHRRMERHVALKVMSAGLMTKPAMVERFHREVKAAARLTHPNIVTAYDADQAGDTHFLVMEFVEGLSLAEHVQKHGPLPVIEACAHIRQAALGLQHALERGMVHRDIKPHNLMLTPTGQVKILDFGLARFVRESAGDQTASSLQAAGPAPSVPPGGLTEVGTLMGTADFIAPEQASDPRRADIRADIYSLGCTLYFLLSGRVPFPGGTSIDKLMAHVEKTPVPLAKLRPEVPAELVRVVEKMMAKDPAQRYQTPAEAARALEPFTRKRSRLAAFIHRHRLATAAGLLAGLVLAFVAAVIIYVQTDNGEFVIETEGPESDAIAIMINKEDGLKIHDRVRKTEYLLKVGKHRLPGGDYQIDVSELPDGVTFSTTTFKIRRGGKERVTVTFRPKGGREQGGGFEKAAKARNPFGVTDVDDPEPDGAEVQTFVSKTKLKGGADDANAGQWVVRPTKGDSKSLDGEWYGRWRRPHLDEDWNYCKGTAQIKTVGERVYILYTDQTDTFLIDTRRENGRLDGAHQGTKVRNDCGPCVFIIAGPDRLDGEFGENGKRGRIDFRRKLAPQAPISEPGLIKKFGPSDKLIGHERVTFTPEYGGWRIEAQRPCTIPLYEIANPGAEECVVTYRARLKTHMVQDRAYLEMLCRFPGKGEAFSRGLFKPVSGTTDWTDYEIPFYLDKGQRPDLIKLNLVIEGKGTGPFGHLWIKDVEVRRAPLPPLSPFTKDLGKRIKAFQPTDKTLTTDRVVRDGDGWRIDSREKEFRTVHLFEVPNPAVDGCLLIYRLQMKTSLLGTAYQEMWCRFPKATDDAPLEGEFFSKGFDRMVSGDTDWTTYLIHFELKKNQRPDLVKLDLVVGGMGQVWVKNVEVIQVPLVP